MMRFVSIILSCCLVFIAYGQNETPEISLVSIINEQGDVRIEWEESLAAGLQHYEISKWSEANQIFQPIGTTNDTFYIDNNSGALNGSVEYRVVAVADNRHQTESDHKTIHLTLYNDVCEEEYHFNWTPYVGWENGDDSGIEYYEIVSSSLGFRPNMEGNDKTFDTSYIYTTPSSASTYFWIRAINKENNQIISFSNIILIEEAILIPPLYVYPDFATVQDQAIKIQFSIDPLSDLDHYALFKIDGGVADTLQVYTRFTDNQITYLDEQVNTDNTKYRYYVEAYKCGEKIDDFETKYANNICLNKELSGSMLKISWNEVIDWESGTNNYQIYRSIDNGDFEMINSVNNMFYEEDMIDVATITNSPIQKISYYVQATENLNSYGYQNQAASNIVDFWPDMDLQFPNAINLNSTDDNEFKPKYLFKPDEYELIIYDKGGSVIWSTKDIDKGWNGTFQNTGKTVPEGVYYFLVKRTDSRGNKIKPIPGLITVISSL